MQLPTSDHLVLNLMKEDLSASPTVRTNHTYVFPSKHHSDRKHFSLLQLLPYSTPWWKSHLLTTKSKVMDQPQRSQDDVVHWMLPSHLFSCFLQLQVWLLNHPSWPRFFPLLLVIVGDLPSFWQCAAWDQFHRCCCHHLCFQTNSVKLLSKMCRLFDDRCLFFFCCW